jgi:hypothetical protein
LKGAEKKGVVFFFKLCLNVHPLIPDLSTQALMWFYESNQIMEFLAKRLGINYKSITYLPLGTRKLLIGKRASAFCKSFLSKP